jgi:hypothetical protein
VTGEHVALAIDQHRHEEGEGFDTARDLADLLWAWFASDCTIRQRFLDF